MFTGHVVELGTIEHLDDHRCQVRAPAAAAAVPPGGAICVSGVGLTVEARDGDIFGATVSAETRRRSTFSNLRPGDRVNVELPLRAGDPVSGHLVQGNVDGVGKVARVEPEDDCLRVWIRPPDRLMARVAAKTRVAVDGVSVTIADRQRDRFSIVVVPATRGATTLGRLVQGSRVNLELDAAARSAGQPARSPAVTAIGRAGLVSGRAGIDQVLAQLAAGGAVAVWDPDHESEGDVIFAGARLRPDAFRFLLTQVCGHPTVPCAGDVLDRLEIGQMPGSGDRFGTAFAIPVDLASGTGTGVSAAERAATVRRLAHPGAVPSNFLRPGHVYPLRARDGLLARRRGHTEATVALCLAAGLPPVGVCCEVMNADGTMAGAADLEVAALAWGLPLIELPELTARL